MAAICIHAIISGKVQGVCFRANTVKKAKQFNLTGWVKNCSDGTVELIACGEQANMDLFSDWLWQGPAHANVTDVKQQTVALENFDDFCSR